MIHSRRLGIILQLQEFDDYSNLTIHISNVR